MVTKALTTPVAVVTAPASSAGCWSNFVSGAGKTVNWCGRQVATGAKAVWHGMKKVAEWAAAFFKRIAFYVGVGIATAITFVKAHSVKFLVGGIALGVGLALGLLFSRLFGCCNKPAKKPAGNANQA